MDVRHILSLLLLLACTMSVALSATNGRGVPNLARLPRRAELNEFLVPPPPPQHQSSGSHPGNSRPPGPRPHGPPLGGPHSSGPRPHGPHPPGPFPQRPPQGGPHLRGPHPPGRTPRVASPRPAEPPGYFSTLMGWLNPFSYGPLEEPPPLGPPQIELSHPPNFNRPQSGGPPPQVFNGPPPSVYGKQHPHPPGKNNQGGYSQPEKNKNCNPCNKVPWIPMQNSASQPENPVYGVPPPPSPGGSYGPPPVVQVNHGASFEPPPINEGNLGGSYGPPPGGQNVHGGFHGGFSQEIRTPDFSYNPPLPVTQDGRPHPVNPLPNPHLYPGPMPPLFKAEPFDEPPIHLNNNNNPEYLNVPPPPPIDHNQYGPPPGIQAGPHGSPSIVESPPPNFHGQPNGLSFESPPNFGGHPDILDHQPRPNAGIESAQGYDDIGPTGQDFGHPESHEHAGDLHSSGSHLNHQSHVNSIISTGKGVDEFSGNKGFAESNPQDHYDQQISPSPGSTDLEDHKQGEDLSSSSSIIKNSHVTVASPGNSGNLEDTIHFEESPVVDLTKQGETSTDLPAVSSSSGTVTFVELDESTEDFSKTTLNYDASNFNEQTQQGPSTESYDFTSTPAVINNSSATSETAASGDHVSFPSYPTGSSEENRYVESGINSAETFHDSRDPRGPDISYIPPSGQPGYLWSIASTTFRPAKDDKTLLNALLKSYNNNLKPGQDQHSQGSAIGPNSEHGTRLSHRQQGVKRNKQVQVIIPYTSQYTPLPFQQAYGDWKGRTSLERTQARKVPQLTESNRYDYIAQESRKEVKTADSAKSTVIPQNISEAQLIAKIATEVDRNSDLKKVNNSIDVHRLQKNIDNWTIQEYSKSPTSSTVIPNPSRPYLSPSKKIPNEYLTTTESIKHAKEDRDDSVKTFALAGFSFNDVDNEGSSSDQLESGRVKVLRVEDSNEEKSTGSQEENSNPTTTTEETFWRGFSVSISPLNKERVYVVTPQTILSTTGRPSIEKKSSNSKNSGKSTDFGSKKTKTKSGEFEAIEKAYQVLPQAVNNLAIASTGPDTVPLWGIMEHEEFASPTRGKQEDDDQVVTPVLYSGHSKVSRGKR